MPSTVTVGRNSVDFNRTVRKGGFDRLKPTLEKLSFIGIRKVHGFDGAGIDLQNFLWEPQSEMQRHTLLFQETRNTYQQQHRFDLDFISLQRTHAVLLKSARMENLFQCLIQSTHP